MATYEYESIEEGLAIYKQERSNNYYVRLRIKVDGKPKEFRKSLKTTDRTKALKVAFGYQSEYERNPSSETFSFLSAKARKIHAIADELLVNFGNQKKGIYEDYSRVLTREIIPKFGSLDICELTRSKIRELFDEYVNSTTQLRIRKTTIRHMFDFAIEKNLIKESERPTFPSVEVEKDEIRSVFTYQELKKIESRFDEFADQGKKELTRRLRTLFKYYFIFLIETGVRPGEEPLNIKLSDFGLSPMRISEDGGFCWKVTINAGKIHSRKKTSSREVVLSDNAVNAVNRVLAMIHHSLGSLAIAQKDFRKDIYIFRLPESQSKKPQFEKIFPIYCDFLGIDNKSKYLTLYSCRHSYITQQQMDGVDIDLIAAQCGTSAAMITERYSKFQATARADELLLNNGQKIRNNF